MFERWHWNLEDVECLDFEDFVLFADACQALYERDMENAKTRTQG
jgi:hypothetical protein